MKRLLTSTLVLLILAACGGGGGGGEDPAPVADATPTTKPTPTSRSVTQEAPTSVLPAPAPTAAVPPPAGPTTGEVPIPAPSPGAVPAPANPAPAVDVVPGAVVYAALLQSWSEHENQAVAQLTVEPGTWTHYRQAFVPQPPASPKPIDQGFTFHSQGDLRNAQPAGRDENHLRGFSIQAPSTVINGQVHLAATLAVGVWSPWAVTMTGTNLLETSQPVIDGGQPFTVNQAQAYETDTGLATWRQGERYVQLILQSDQDPVWFRLCWHGQLETVKRVMCGRFLRSTGAFVGVRVVDDSYGLGPKVWE